MGVAVADRASSLWCGSTCRADDGILGRLLALAAACLATPQSAPLASMLRHGARRENLIASREQIRARMAAGNTVQVTTPFGVLEGFVTSSNKSQHFLGVPFAQPPVGGLRWQAPQQPFTWTGVRSAAWFGPSCPQSSGVETLGTSISEDCLYLNVYRPNSAPPASGWPVMVFLYGGSWKEGSGALPIYYADEDVGLVGDVMVVTLNYRLAAFGWLASETLRAQDADNSTGNYGLQDQRAALRWVRQAIGAFGGNPSSVMLFGESAGAGSTSCHLVARRSWGLFDRAGMESGPFSPWSAIPYNISSLKYARLAQNAGCAAAGAAPEAISADASVLSCLRGLNMSQILDYGKHTTSGDARVDWAPVIDGVELTASPPELAAAGQFADVPVLLGSNQDEGTVFSQASESMNASQFPAWLLSEYGPQIAAAVAPVYPLSNYPSPWWADTHIIGDGLMSCPARRSSRWLTAANSSPVYLYFYQHVLELLALFAPDKGCCHGSELMMVFKFDLALWTSDESHLADLFVRYWTRFAATGNPNGGSDPVWPAYSAAADQLLVLDVANGTAPAAGVKKPVCDVWDATPIPPSLVFGS